MAKAKPPSKPKPKPKAAPKPKAKPKPEPEPEPEDMTIDDEPEYKMVTYWLDTGWACGMVEVMEGVVVDAAPIFRRFRGQRLDVIAKRYKVKPCTEEYVRAVRAPL